MTGGAGGFLITGISAYVHHNLCVAAARRSVAPHCALPALTRRLRARSLFFLDASEIQFFPQGLVRPYRAPCQRIKARNRLTHLCVF